MIASVSRFERDVGDQEDRQRVGQGAPIRDGAHVEAERHGGGCQQTVMVTSGRGRGVVVIPGKR